MASPVPDALVGSMIRQPKDKKPFTYLPGGLDLSEIRSPRMARRLAKHQANIVQVRLLIYLLPHVPITLPL